MKSFHSNGKLLLTAEYVVLDGAMALALPTKYGQYLEVVNTKIKNEFIWESIDHENNVWFSNSFTFNNGKLTSQNTDLTSNRLLNIFNVLRKLDPEIEKNIKGKHFISKLEFPQNWGLGSSSTLINNIAQWANVDPYILLEHTFGGSGYDIACAQINSPITYCLEKRRTIKKVDFNPNFKSQLFFVHLNKKQDSRSGIAKYDQNKSELEYLKAKISNITKEIINTNNLKDFETLLTNHEELISKVIKTPTIKDEIFSDYPNMIKSLGAWGGDFILSSGNSKARNYFKGKGYHTIIEYDDMIMNQ